MFILDWLLANLPAITASFAAGYAFALTIVKLTPTKADDELLDKVHDKVSELSKLLPMIAMAGPVIKAAVAAAPSAPVADKPKA